MAEAAAPSPRVQGISGRREGEAVGTGRHTAAELVSLAQALALAPALALALALVLVLVLVDALLRSCAALGCPPPRSVKLRLRACPGRSVKELSLKVP